MPVLIGWTSNDVYKYFDSLNHLKENPYYKIITETNATGDLVYKTEFSLQDEKFYTCMSITAVFLRSKGTEYCVTQYLTGRTEYAQPNLAYVKDNFTFVSDNKWEKTKEGIPLKIVAAFESRISGSSHFYTMRYSVGD